MKDREYYREYRRRRGESLCLYAREYAREHYVPKPRLPSLSYNALYSRARRSGSIEAFKEWWALRGKTGRAKRLATIEDRLQATYAHEIEKAMLDPELSALIAEQAKDARSFCIKYDLSFDEDAPEWERGRRTVYSIV